MGTTTMGPGETVHQRHHGWKLEGWARLKGLERDIAELKATKTLHPDQEAEIDRLHGEADDAMGKGGGPDFFWQVTHRLEERIAAATGTCDVLFVDYVAWAVRHMEDPLAKKHPDLLASPAYKAVREAHKNPGNATGDDAVKIARYVGHLIHEVHSLQDEEHWLRNEQNSRLKVAAAVAAGLSGLIVMMSLLLDDLPFLVGADSFSDVPSVQLVGLVVLGGLVGGSWGALPALMSTRNDRYRTQRVRAVVRMCLGVLAALIGISLIGAAWVSDFDAATAPALFAAAVAFGLTQEPVTRILEDKASKATDKTDSDTAAD